MNGFTAAQEAVAWKYRAPGKSFWRVSFNKPVSPDWEALPLYAAPVAAAPVGVTRDDAEQAISRIMGEYGFSMPSRAYAELVDELMSTPAAPGIDRDQLGDLLEGMTVSIDVDGLLNTDGRRLFGTVTAVQHDDNEPRGLMLLVQDVQKLIDASPKGGIQSQVVGEVRIADGCVVSTFIKRPLPDGGYDIVPQPTSAEVGS